MTDEGPGTRPELSIVIVNYRSWGPLSACLASLGAGAGDRASAQPLRHEVIVVDNESGDGRFDDFAAAYPAVRFVAAGRNAGFAAGCNRGASLATGRWLLFLNPDARDPGGQIDQLLATAAGRSASIVGCRQVDETGRPQKVFDAFPDAANVLPALRALRRVLAPQRWPDARRCQDAWRSVDWVSGSALLIRAEVLAALGGWSERYFMYSEDVDLCRRARDLGHQVAFTATVTLIHGHGGSSRSSPEVSALTRAETTVSRHLYVAAHFRPVPAAIAHTLLAISRTLPAACLGLLAPLLPLPGLERRRAIAARIGRAYRRRLRTGEWSSEGAPPKQ